MFELQGKDFKTYFGITEVMGVNSIHAGLIFFIFLQALLLTADLQFHAFILGVVLAI